jgi:flagellar protein FlaJ
MAAVAKRVFSENFMLTLDQRLESTKIALSAGEYLGLSLLTAVIVSIGVGFTIIIFNFPIPLFLTFLVMVLVAIASFLSLTILLPKYLTQRRAAELERMLPDALRQMASILRAGVSIDGALNDIAKSRYGELSREFERVLTEVKRGRTLESALLALAKRTHSPLYDRAFRLIVEGVEKGAALAGVLDAVATDAKEVHAIQRERRSVTTQQVIFLFAVALFAVPFVVGLTAGIGGISALGRLPPEMATIAMAYIAIQAFICGLAIGVIRYGRMSKGISYSIPSMIVATIVFTVARTIVASMAPV